VRLPQAITSFESLSRFYFCTFSKVKQDQKWKKMTNVTKVSPSFTFLHHVTLPSPVVAFALSVVSHSASSTPPFHLHFWSNCFDCFDLVTFIHLCLLSLTSFTYLHQPYDSHGSFKLHLCSASLCMSVLLSQRCSWWLVSIILEMGHQKHHSPLSLLLVTVQNYGWNTENS
jgi:hypothetical protein